MTTTTAPAPAPAPAAAAPHPSTPPKPPPPRFTLELEFVLSLSNPYYLSQLALTYPHLLNPAKEPATGESDATKFASYLAYLYTYWRQPEYARFLTHPGATLRNLELLQQEAFRRDIIRPDVVERLLAAGASDVEGGERGEETAAAAVVGKGTGQEGGQQVKREEKDEDEDEEKTRRGIDETRT